MKEYTNKEITIVWKPELCTHSTKCWKGLIEVFNPKARPWIDPYGANTERIIEQIKQCPSGALSYYNSNSKVPQENNNSSNVTIEVLKDGPLIVHGSINVKDSDGKTIKKREGCAFCRCGASNNKPYCDGSHFEINFKG